jgi:hypothetical protein
MAQVQPGLDQSDVPFSETALLIEAGRFSLS